MEKNSLLQYKIKTYRDKALKGFLCFLAFMLCCTILSRGIYAYRMPQVETGKAERKSIEHAVFVPGNVRAVCERPVVLPPGIRIEEICVSPGERVETDTVLLQLNMESLTGMTEAVENQIALLEQQLQEMRAAQSIADRTRKTVAERAKEDLDNVTQTQELLLQQARGRYEDAANALSAYPAWETYYDAKTRQDGQYQALRDDPGQEEAFWVYENTLRLSLQEAWAQERDTLENAVKEAERALQLAENDRNVAIKGAERVLEDATQETVGEKSGIMELEQRKEVLEKELETYRKLAEQEGKVFCGVEGAVRTIHAASGDRTPDTAVMHLADGSKGWIFETALTEEEMRYLDAEAPVTLKFRNGEKRLADCPILTVTKMDDAGYLVTVETGDAKMSEGEQGILEFARQEGPYDCCVPASAVHIVDGRSFIFVIRTADTILGTELHIVKRPVKIVDQNDTYVALEDGALGEEEQIVVGCDRELAAGDVVRPMEQKD